jgi:hypothetical protein
MDFAILFSAKEKPDCSCFCNQAEEWKIGNDYFLNAG